jgi:spore maturation protein CgeB
MGHIQTYDPTFIPYETYVPYKHDLSDLNEKIDTYLQNTAERKRITQNAFETYAGILGRFRKDWAWFFEKYRLVQNKVDLVNLVKE